VAARSTDCCLWFTLALAELRSSQWMPMLLMSDVYIGHSLLFYHWYHVDFKYFYIYQTYIYLKYICSSLEDTVLAASCDVGGMVTCFLCVPCLENKQILQRTEEMHS